MLHKKELTDKGRPTSAITHCVPYIRALLKNTRSIYQPTLIALKIYILRLTISCEAPVSVLLLGCDVRA